MCIHSGSWPFTFRCPFCPRWFGEHAQLKSHMMTFLFPPPGHSFQPFLFNEPDLAVDPKKRQCFHAKCVGKHLTDKACWSDTWELILERSHIFVKSVVKDYLIAPVLKLTGSYHLTHLCSGYSEIRSKRWTGKQTQTQYTLYTRMQALVFHFWFPVSIAVPNFWTFLTNLIIPSTGFPLFYHSFI